MQQAMTAGRKVVVGLGKTGLSCARYLRHTGQDFAVVDSRENPPGLAEFRKHFPEVPVELGPFRAESLMAASELLLSPGVSLQEPAIAEAIACGVAAYGDIDIFARRVKAPIVAVTGSNGKSTVVSLLGAMARRAGVDVCIGGNLDGAEARPALDMLLEEPRELYVLELSSFQLETTAQLNAEAVVILNLSEDHMDRYPSMNEYLQAKQRIFLGCHQAIVNRDDPASTPPAFRGRRWTYGLGIPAQNEFGVLSDADGGYLAFGAQRLMSVSEMRVAGRHNVSNALAALALGHAVGLDSEAMLQTLREFPGLPHRCQWVREVNGVAFYNDSKGTNPGASVVAISSIAESIRGAIILIAGGLGKGADFSVMHPVVMEHVRVLVLIGRDAQQLAEALNDVTEIRFADSMQEAVSTAFGCASEGDAVLLSPACASMDMFTDFTHRGRVFMDAVETLQ